MSTLIRPRPSPRRARAPSTLFEDAYGGIVEVLACARAESGMSQRELARRLGRAQSHVYRIEAQERRVDLLEFYRIAEALGLDPVALFARVVVRVRAAES